MASSSSASAASSSYDHIEVSHVTIEQAASLLFSPSTSGDQRRTIEEWCTLKLQRPEMVGGILLQHVLIGAAGRGGGGGVSASSSSPSPPHSHEGIFLALMLMRKTIYDAWPHFTRLVEAPQYYTILSSLLHQFLLFRCVKDAALPRYVTREVQSIIVLLLKEGLAEYEAPCVGFIKGTLCGVLALLWEMMASSSSAAAAAAASSDLNTDANSNTQNYNNNNANNNNHNTGDDCQSAAAPSSSPAYDSIGGVSYSLINTYSSRQDVTKAITLLLSVLHDLVESFSHLNVRRGTHQHRKCALLFKNQCLDSIFKLAMRVTTQCVVTGVTPPTVADNLVRLLLQQPQRYPLPSHSAATAAMGSNGGGGSADGPSSSYSSLSNAIASQIDLHNNSAIVYDLLGLDSAVNFATACILGQEEVNAGGNGSGGATVTRTTTTAAGSGATSVGMRGVGGGGGGGGGGASSARRYHPRNIMNNNNGGIGGSFTPYRPNGGTTAGYSPAASASAASSSLFYTPARGGGGGFTNDGFNTAFVGTPSKGCDTDDLMYSPPEGRGGGGGRGGQHYHHLHNQQQQQQFTNGGCAPNSAGRRSVPLSTLGATYDNRQNGTAAAAGAIFNGGSDHVSPQPNMSYHHQHNSTSNGYGYGNDQYHFGGGNSNRMMGTAAATPSSSPIGSTISLSPFLRNGASASEASRRRQHQQLSMMGYTHDNHTSYNTNNMGMGPSGGSAQFTEGFLLNGNSETDIATSQTTANNDNTTAADNHDAADADDEAYLSSSANALDDENVFMLMRLDWAQQCSFVNTIATTAALVEACLGLLHAVLGFDFQCLTPSQHHHSGGGAGASGVGGSVQIFGLGADLAGGLSSAGSSSQQRSGAAGIFANLGGGGGGAGKGGGASTAAGGGSSGGGGGGINSPTSAAGPSSSPYGSSSAGGGGSDSLPGSDAETLHFPASWLATLLDSNIFGVLLTLYEGRVMSARGLEMATTNANASGAVRSLGGGGGGGRRNGGGDLYDDDDDDYGGLCGGNSSSLNRNPSLMRREGTAAPMNRSGTINNNNGFNNSTHNTANNNSSAFGGVGVHDLSSHTNNNDDHHHQQQQQHNQSASIHLHPHGGSSASSSSIFPSPMTAAHENNHLEALQEYRCCSSSSSSSSQSQQPIYMLALSIMTQLTCARRSLFENEDERAMWLRQIFGASLYLARHSTHFIVGDPSLTPLAIAAKRFGGDFQVAAVLFGDGAVGVRPLIESFLDVSAPSLVESIRGIVSNTSAGEMGAGIDDSGILGGSSASSTAHLHTIATTSIIQRHNAVIKPHHLSHDPNALAEYCKLIHRVKPNFHLNEMMRQKRLYQLWMHSTAAFTVDALLHWRGRPDPQRTSSAEQGQYNAQIYRNFYATVLELEGVVTIGGGGGGSSTSSNGGGGSNSNAAADGSPSSLLYDPAAALDAKVNHAFVYGADWCRSATKYYSRLNMMAMLQEEGEAPPPPPLPNGNTTNNGGDANTGAAAAGLHHPIPSTTADHFANPFIATVFCPSIPPPSPAHLEERFLTPLRYYQHETLLNHNGHGHSNGNGGGVGTNSTAQSNNGSFVAAVHSIHRAPLPQEAVTQGLQLIYSGAGVECVHEMLQRREQQQQQQNGGGGNNPAAAAVPFTTPDTLLLSFLSNAAAAAAPTATSTTTTATYAAAEPYFTAVSPSHYPFLDLAQINKAFPSALNDRSGTYDIATLPLTAAWHRFVTTTAYAAPEGVSYLQDVLPSIVFAYFYSRGCVAAATADASAEMCAEITKQQQKQKQQKQKGTAASYFALFPEFGPSPPEEDEYLLFLQSRFVSHMVRHVYSSVGPFLIGLYNRCAKAYVDSVEFSIGQWMTVGAAPGQHRERQLAMCRTMATIYAQQTRHLSGAYGRSNANNNGSTNANSSSTNSQTIVARSNPFEGELANIVRITPATNHYVSSAAEFQLAHLLYFFASLLRVRAVYIPPAPPAPPKHTAATTLIPSTAIPSTARSSHGGSSGANGGHGGGTYHQSAMSSASSFPISSLPTSPITSPNSALAATREFPSAGGGGGAVMLGGHAGKGIGGGGAVGSMMVVGGRSTVAAANSFYQEQQRLHQQQHYGVGGGGHSPLSPNSNGFPNYPSSASPSSCRQRPLLSTPSEEAARFDATLLAGVMGTLLSVESRRVEATLHRPEGVAAQLTRCLNEAYSRASSSSSSSSAQRSMSGGEQSSLSSSSSLPMLCPPFLQQPSRIVASILQMNPSLLADERAAAAAASGIPQSSSASASASSSSSSLSSSLCYAGEGTSLYSIECAMLAFLQSFRMIYLSPSAVTGSSGGGGGLSSSSAAGGGGGLYGSSSSSSTSTYVGGGRSYEGGGGHHHSSGSASGGGGGKVIPLSLTLDLVGNALLPHMAGAGSPAAAAMMMMGSTSSSNGGGGAHQHQQSHHQQQHYAPSAELIVATQRFLAAEVVDKAARSLGLWSGYSSHRGGGGGGDCGGEASGASSDPPHSSSTDYVSSRFMHQFVNVHGGGSGSGSGDGDDDVDCKQIISCTLGLFLDMSMLTSGGGGSSSGGGAGVGGPSPSASSSPTFAAPTMDVSNGQAHMMMMGSIGGGCLSSSSTNNSGGADYSVSAAALAEHYRRRHRITIQDLLSPPRAATTAALPFLQHTHFRRLRLRFRRVMSQIIFLEGASAEQIRSYLTPMSAVLRECYQSLCGGVVAKRTSSSSVSPPPPPFAIEYLPPSAGRSYFNRHWYHKRLLAALLESGCMQQQQSHHHGGVGSGNGGGRSIPTKARSVSSSLFLPCIGDDAGDDAWDLRVLHRVLTLASSSDYTSSGGDEGLSLCSPSAAADCFDPFGYFIGGDAIENGSTMAVTGGHSGDTNANARNAVVDAFIRFISSNDDGRRGGGGAHLQQHRRYHTASNAFMVNPSILAHYRQSCCVMSDASSSSSNFGGDNGGGGYSSYSSSSALSSSSPSLYDVMRTTYARHVVASTLSDLRGVYQACQGKRIYHTACFDWLFAVVGGGGGGGGSSGGGSSGGDGSAAAGGSVGGCTFNADTLLWLADYATAVNDFGGQHRVITHVPENDAEFLAANTRNCCEDVAPAGGGGPNTSSSASVIARPIIANDAVLEIQLLRLVSEMNENRCQRIQFDQQSVNGALFFQFGCKIVDVLLNRRLFRLNELLRMVEQGSCSVSSWEEGLRGGGGSDGNETVAPVDGPQSSLSSSKRSRGGPAGGQRQQQQYGGSGSALPSHHHHHHARHHAGGAEAEATASSFSSSFARSKTAFIHSRTRLATSSRILEAKAHIQRNFSRSDERKLSFALFGNPFYSMTNDTFHYNYVYKAGYLLATNCAQLLSVRSDGCNASFFHVFDDDTNVRLVANAIQIIRMFTYGELQLYPKLLKSYFSLVEAVCSMFPASPPSTAGRVDGVASGGMVMGGMGMMGESSFFPSSSNNNARNNERSIEQILSAPSFSSECEVMLLNIPSPSCSYGGSAEPIRIADVSSACSLSSSHSNATRSGSSGGHMGLGGIVHPSMAPLVQQVQSASSSNYLPFLILATGPTSTPSSSHNSQHNSQNPTNGGAESNGGNGGSASPPSTAATATADVRHLLGMVECLLDDKATASLGGPYKTAHGASFECSLNALSSLLKVLHEAHHYTLAKAYHQLGAAAVGAARQQQSGSCGGGYACGAGSGGGFLYDHQQQHQQFASGMGAYGSGGNGNGHGHGSTVTVTPTNPATIRTTNSAASNTSATIFPTCFTHYAFSGGGGEEDDPYSCSSSSSPSSASAPLPPLHRPSDVHLAIYRAMRDEHLNGWWWWSVSGGSSSSDGVSVGGAPSSSSSSSSSPAGGAPFSPYNSPTSVAGYYSTSDWPSRMLHILLTRCVEEEGGGRSSIYALQPIVLLFVVLWPEALLRVEGVFGVLYARRAAAGGGGGGTNNNAMLYAQQQHQQHQHNGMIGGGGDDPSSSQSAAAATEKVRAVFKLLTHQLRPPCPVHGGEEAGSGGGGGGANHHHANNAKNAPHHNGGGGGDYYSLDAGTRAYFERRMYAADSSGTAASSQQQQQHSHHHHQPQQQFQQCPPHHHHHPHSHHSTAHSAHLCLCGLHYTAWLPIMSVDKRRRERFNQNLTMFCEALKAF